MVQPPRVNHNAACCLVDGLRRHEAPLALQADRGCPLGSVVRTSGPESSVWRTVTSGAGDPDGEEQVMNQELSPTVLAELQESLVAHHQHLETELGELRRTEGVGGKQEDDPSIEVRGDQGEASVEIEAWAIAHRKKSICASNWPRWSTP